ncbi:Metallophosphoesterase, partial [Pseudomonas syringae pv. spinaceae]
MEFKHALRASRQLHHCSVSYPLTHRTILEAQMKLRIYSDLHLEFASYDMPALDPSIDLVILGGDIDKKCRGVKWANENFTCPVAYVSPPL